MFKYEHKMYDTILHSVRSLRWSVNMYEIRYRLHTSASSSRNENRFSEDYKKRKQTETWDQNDENEIRFTQCTCDTINDSENW